MASLVKNKIHTEAGEKKIPNSRKENVFTVTKNFFTVYNKESNIYQYRCLFPKWVFYFFIDVFGILNSIRNSCGIKFS